MKNLKLTRCNDRETWNRFVAESPQGSIFCDTRLLDAYDVDYDLWFLYKGGLPAVAVPIIRRGKEVLGPQPFAYYRGPMFAPEVNALQHYRTSSWIIDLTQALLSELSERYDSLCFSLHYSLNDVRGFDWFNYHNPDGGRFEIAPRYTALVDLESFLDFDDFIHAVRKDRRQDRRNALENEVVIEETRDIALLSDLYEMTFSRQGLTVAAEEMKILWAVTEAALKHGFGQLLVARASDGRAVSAQLIYYDHRSAHAVIGANSPQSRLIGAGTFICFEFVRRSWERKLKWADFNGANSPDRAEFKHSFNAIPRLYFTVRWQRSSSPSS